MLQNQNFFLSEHKNKQFETDFKLKLCKKRLYTTTHVRYPCQILSILTDEKLNWDNRTNNTTVWGQTRIPQKRITVLLKKELRIMSFAPFNFHLSSYFHDYSILKFCDIINIEVSAFINNCFNSNTFSVFSERFKLVSESHAHNTRSSSKGLLFVPSYNTARLGRKLVIFSATLTWNHLQNKDRNQDFMNFFPKALKNILTQKLIPLYCK